jgi:hypothetical protein
MFYLNLQFMIKIKNLQMSNNTEETLGQKIIGWDGFTDLPMFMIVCYIAYFIVRY